MRYARYPVEGLPGCHVILERRDHGLYRESTWFIAIDEGNGDWRDRLEREPPTPPVRNGGSIISVFGIGKAAT
jgi:hypothetical protein